MTPLDPASAHGAALDDGIGYATGSGASVLLSDEAAVRRLYELATDGANGSPEFARLDALVYERLMQTYEHGGGTAGIRHLGANRSG